MNGTLTFCTTAYLRMGWLKNAPGVLALQNNRLSFETKAGIVFSIDSSKVMVAINFLGYRMTISDGTKHYIFITDRQVQLSELGQPLADAYLHITHDGTHSLAGDILKNNDSDLYNAYLEGKYHMMMWIPLLRHENATIIDKSAKPTRRAIIIGIILGLLLIAFTISVRLILNNL